MKNLNTILLASDLSVDKTTADGTGQKYTTEQPIQAFSQHHNVIRLYVPYSNDYVVYGIFQANNDEQTVGDPAQFILFDKIDGTETIDSQVYHVYEQTIPSAIISSPRASRIEFVASLWSKEPYIDPITSTTYRFLGLQYVNVDENPATEIAEQFDNPSANDYVRVIFNGVESDWYWNGSAWIDSETIFNVLINEYRTELLTYALRKGKTTGLPTHNPTNTEFIIDSLNSKLATSSAISMFYQKSESDFRYVNADGDTIRGDIDMSGHRIINVDSLEALNVTIGDLNIQQQLDAKVSRDGTLPMTGDLNVNSNSLTNVDQINGKAITPRLNNVDGLISGTVRAKKSEQVDDGLGNLSTALEVKQTVDNVNQDVKTTATPEFVGVKIGANTITETKADQYDAAYAHSQITDGTNPHQTISAEIDVNTTLYTDPTKHLDSQANNIQTALDQLYNHAHDAEYVKLSQLGVDVAELGQDGKVLAEQLPSYVDDIVEYQTRSALPTIGDKGKIYVVTNDPNPDNNTTYRWGETGYFKFDQRTAEWGSISGTITNQTDVELALFTSTVSGGSITGSTIKDGLNQLDNKVKQVVQGSQQITFADPSITSTNVAGAISEVKDDADAVDQKVDNVIDGTTDIAFADPDITATTIDQAVSEVQDNVDAVNTRVDNVVAGTTNIAYQSTTVAGELGSLKTQIDNVTSGATDITYDGSTVAATLTDHESRITTAESDIDNVESGTAPIAYNNTTSGLTSTTIKLAIDEIYLQKAQPNGLASLDSTGRLPANQLTLSAIEFKGVFGSTGNLPTSNVQNGDLYVCNTNDFTDATSGITFNNGDKALFADGVWYKNDAYDAVTSVNGQVGAVDLDGQHIDVSTTNFDGHLSANDDTVQKALDTLDDHTHLESDITNLDKYTQNEVDGFLATKSNVGHTHTESEVVDLDKYSQGEVDSLLANKVDIGALASSIILYPTTAASDITNYNRLVTSINDPDFDSPAVNIPTGAITTQDQLVAELVSDENLFVGNPGTLNVPTVGLIRKTTTNTNQHAEFYFKIYQRKANGTEIEIAISDTTGEITTLTYEEFNASALLNNGEFVATDRLVIKYFGNNIGGGSPAYEFQFGGVTPVRTLLNVPINVVLSADRITYDSTASSLDVDNVQLAIDQLDTKILNRLTSIRVEQFDIVNPDVGDGTFTYQDANNQTQTGTYDGTWYTFDLQIAGFYANNNLVTATINDDAMYHTTDSDQLEEGTPDSENVVTSVKVAHSFTAGDEIDIRYYQGVSIAAQSIGDGSVTYGKLDSNLQADINAVRAATPTNNPNTIVERNGSNEFAGILDGKLKTPRAISLGGDLSGSANFDGSASVTITATVADDSHNHTNLGGEGITYNAISSRYDVDKATTLQAQGGTLDTVFMTPAKTKAYVDDAVIDGGTF